LLGRSVGYESDAAFSKALKRVVGANPGEYVKRGFEDPGMPEWRKVFEAEDSGFGGGA
jgi:AraC-like DNA-binding protein